MVYETATAKAAYVIERDAWVIRVEIPCKYFSDYTGEKLIAPLLSEIDELVREREAIFLMEHERNGPPPGDWWQKK